MRRISPAEHVITTIGGVRETARALGRAPSTISSWRKERGTNGAIPRMLFDPILAYAKRRKLDITVTDLIVGRIRGLRKTTKRA